MKEDVVHMREIRNAYGILIGKRCGNWPLEIPKIKGRGNIKMYLRKILCENLNWIKLTQMGVQLADLYKYGDELSCSMKVKHLLIVWLINVASPRGCMKWCGTDGGRILFLCRFGQLVSVFVVFLVFFFCFFVNRQTVIVFCRM